MTLEQYIDNINAKYILGNATEHTFRGLLEQLIESIVPDIRATNEPKRQQCGAPDYILTKKDNLSRSDSGIPVGFIEAKDIGDKDLAGVKKTGNKEQFDRYKSSLNNLIFTDYLDFHLYRDGIFITKIAIGEITTPPVGHPSKGEYRVPNLNLEIVNKIAKSLGLKFVSEKTTPNSHPLEECPAGEVELAPIDILDYIYAVLHSPTYREKYKEFLKIDFPKIPYPKDLSTFKKLTNLGAQIREIHLLESATVEEYITEFNIDGNCIVDKPKFVNSPPLEGCPTGGVVISSLQEHPTGGVVTKSNEKEIFVNNIKIKQNPILELPYNEALKQRAKELRQAENLSEVLFWMQVTKNGFHKIDFDRQRIIGNYIVDFYVKKLGLVIEIDGSSHDNKQEYDAKRQQYLESLGLRVYRIEVADIMNRMKIVLKDLENYIVAQYAEEPPHPACTPPKEGNLPPHLSGTPQDGNLPSQRLGIPLVGNAPSNQLGTPQKGNLGKVFINETQHFENVPEVAWNFYIGGYQPAQKWLKDRKGRKLEFDDILHYQKIIVALTETDRLMKEIDTIEME